MKDIQEILRGDNSVSLEFTSKEYQGNITFRENAFWLDREIYDTRGKMLNGTALFTELTDTPNSLTGEAGKYVRVNPAENGLVFVTGQDPTVATTWGEIVGDITTQVDLNTLLTSKESNLGDPVADNMVLSSLVNGTRSWVDAATISGVPQTTDSLIEGNSNFYFTEARVTNNTDVLLNTMNRHNHSNKPLLDSLITTGTGIKFLADDGVYREGVGGVTDHSMLVNRNLADQHSISSITDLQPLLDHIPNTTDNLTEGVANQYYTDAKVSTNGDVLGNTTARHTHSNKALLDSLITTGTGNKYLSDDGTYNPVIGGGAATWGSIGGLLSDQSDLQTTLDSKEASLGNPVTTGLFLSSTSTGVRSWVAVDGGQLEEDVIILKHTYDSFASIQVQIDVLPKDMAGKEIVILFADGAHDWGNDMLNLMGFHNGRIRLEAATMIAAAGTNQNATWNLNGTGYLKADNVYGNISIAGIKVTPTIGNVVFQISGNAKVTTTLMYWDAHLCNYETSVFYSAGVDISSYKDTFTGSLSYITNFVKFVRGVEEVQGGHIAIFEASMNTRVFTNAANGVGTASFNSSEGVFTNKVVGDAVDLSAAVEGEENINLLQYTALGNHSHSPGNGQVSTDGYFIYFNLFNASGSYIKRILLTIEVGDTVAMTEKTSGGGDKYFIYVVKSVSISGSVCTIERETSATGGLDFDSGDNIEIELFTVKGTGTGSNVASVSYPYIGTVTDTSIEITPSFNRNGIIYWGAYLSTSSVPLKSEIEAGTNAEVFGNTTVTGGGSNSIVITGLSAETDYTNYIFGRDGWKNDSEVRSTSATTSMAVDNLPTATNVTIAGTETEGETLTGTYTYTDADGDAESGSTYAWYRADDASGTNLAAISGATSQTYTLIAADVSKFIMYGVTPANANGTGIEGTSAYTGAIAAAASAMVAPTLTLGTVTDHTIPISWNDPNSGADTGLVIEVKESSEATWDKMFIASRGISDYTIKGIWESGIGADLLVPGTNYDIRAYFRGNGMLGDSDYTTISNTTTTGSLPGQDTMGTATVEDIRPRGFRISFGHVNNATNLRVEYRVSGTTDWVHYKHGVKVNDSIYVTGLTPNTDYEARVKAVTNGGRQFTVWSNTVTVTTLAVSGDMLMTISVTTDGDSFTLPFNGTNDINIDWGDGNSDASITVSNPTHTYATAGTYLVKVGGTATSFSFLSTNTSASMVIGIDQMGIISYSNIVGLLSNCPNVEYLYMQDINLTNITTLESLVNNAPNLYTIDARNLNFTSITSMRTMLYRTKAYLYNEGWSNTNNITDFYRFAYQSTSREIPVENIDFSGATNLQYTFLGIKSEYLDTLNMNVGTATTMYGMFNDNKILSLFTRNWVTASPNMEIFARRSDFKCWINPNAFWGNGGIASHSRAFEDALEISNYSDIPNNWKNIALTAPALNAPTMGSTTADLTWSDPNPDSGAGNENEENVIVLYRTAGGGSWTTVSLAADTVSYQITGLSASTNYDFAIRVTNATSENSPESNIQTASTTA